MTSPPPSLAEAAQALSDKAPYRNNHWYVVPTRLAAADGPRRGERNGRGGTTTEPEGEVSQYRKKIVIEAYEFQNRVGPDTRPDWILAAQLAGTVTFHKSASGPPHLTIKTLEGEMRADCGDWIIRGVKGELYPIRDDIFRETYEAVDAAATDSRQPDLFGNECEGMCGV